MSITIKILGVAILFLFTIVTGIWLSHSGNRLTL